MYHPILNVQKFSGEEPRLAYRLWRAAGFISKLTRLKISESLKGRKDFDITLRSTKKSITRKGNLNLFYGKGPRIKPLDIVAEKAVRTR